MIRYRVYYIERKTKTLVKIGFSSTSKSRLRLYLKNLVEENLHKYRRELLIVKAVCSNQLEVLEKPLHNKNQVIKFLESEMNF